MELRSSGLAALSLPFESSPSLHFENFFPIDLDFFFQKSHIVEGTGYILVLACLFSSDLVWMGICLFLFNLGNRFN